LTVILLSLLVPTAHAQVATFYPDGAEVNMYFPHLADGGTSQQQWQTAFLFVNPSTLSTAFVTLELFGDDGHNREQQPAQGLVVVLIALARIFSGVAVPRFNLLG
jgi:hypothetical protein